MPVNSGDGDEWPHAVTQGIWLALLNACFIAGYTLVDGTGVRLSDTALGYALDLLYERLLPAGLGDGGASARGVQLPAPALEKGLLGGVGTMGSYGLALWAMTQAPLAVVAALRETSILFGALIAFVLLKEKVAGLRIAAALGIAVGAILLRLA